VGGEDFERAKSMSLRRPWMLDLKEGSVTLKSTRQAVVSEPPANKIDSKRRTYRCEGYV
jgi:hypothetical protein